MRGHDDLAMADLLHPPHQLQKFDLARRRQRGFRFVEDEDALSLTALLEEAQKAFAIGMREEVRRRRPEWVVQRRLVQIPCNREEALRAEEPTVCNSGQPACA